jgi:hypothetical protein
LKWVPLPGFTYNQRASLILGGTMSRNEHTYGSADGSFSTDFVISIVKFKPYCLPGTEVWVHRCYASRVLCVLRICIQVCFGEAASIVFQITMMFSGFMHGVPRKVSQYGNVGFHNGRSLIPGFLLLFRMVCYDVSRYIKMYYFSLTDISSSYIRVYSNDSCFPKLLLFCWVWFGFPVLAVPYFLVYGGVVYTPRK